MNTQKIIKTLKYKINCTWAKQLDMGRRDRLRRRIINYYAENPTRNEEIEEAVAYLQDNPLHVIPNTLIRQYPHYKVTVLLDESNGLHYVVFDNKRLYFRRSSSLENIRITFSNLLAEQDSRSPHCYVSRHFTLGAGDVLLDVGCAEAFLTLLHIDHLQQVCLFEIDPEWIEALNYTFAPWKEKVLISSKYVSDCDDDTSVTIDTFMQAHSIVPTFVKIDVEGMEQKVLGGMQETLRIPSIKVAMTTYHRAKDYETYKQYLEERDFTIETSQGVMIFVDNWRTFRPPYFRYGLIRAQRR